MNKNRDIKPKTKVVVRNLPQQLSEEQFRATLEKFLDDSDYFFWETSFKNLQTRCFLNFKTPDAARLFVQKFNGHIFITPKGKEQRAIVEYTIFQKTPKKSKKPDPRENSIEADAEYQKFLEELKKPTVQLPSAEEQLDKRLAETQGVEPVIVTPLMEFIRNKRAMKAQKSQQRAQGRKKKEENKPVTPNKQADEKVENKRKDRSSRRKERDEKKKEKKKEVKQQQSQQAQAEKQTTEKPAPSKPQEKQNEPKAEKNAEKQASKKETADKKDRNGIWMVRQHIEPGTVAIQQREKPSAPLNKDATAFQPGSMAHLQQFQPQPLSYQAQPFVPQFQTMVPAYYQTAPPYQPPIVSHPIPQPAPQVVSQPAKQNPQQPNSPGSNPKKQQGRGGQRSGGKNEKRPSQKVYAPKQASQGGNAQQTTGNAPGP